MRLIALAISSVLLLSWPLEAHVPSECFPLVQAATEAQRDVNAQMAQARTALEALTQAPDSKAALADLLTKNRQQADATSRSLKAIGKMFNCISGLQR